MTARWPDRLRPPTIEGYAIRPGETILRTEMEAGPARQRRRFTDAPSRITVRWLMDPEEFRLFEAWYRYVGLEGGTFFEIELLGGLGMVAQEARFTRQFEARPLPGGHWEVACELEVRARPTLSAGGLAILLGEDPAGLTASIDALHMLVHETLPGAHAW